MSLLNMKIIKKKENKRKTRLMLNIEKYKDVVLENLNNCHLEKSLRELYGETVVCCPHMKCDECKKRMREWLLEEAKKPILDDAEREYLSAVIRPFREEVDTISKFRTWEESLQNICISTKDHRICTLPVFPKDTMYKGMKEGKNYSLKELGL